MVHVQLYIVWGGSGCLGCVCVCGQCMIMITQYFDCERVLWENASNRWCTCWGCFSLSKLPILVCGPIRTWSDNPYYLSEWDNYIKVRCIAGFGCQTPHMIKIKPTAYVCILLVVCICHGHTSFNHHWGARPWTWQEPGKRKGTRNSWTLLAPIPEY